MSSLIGALRVTLGLDTAAFEKGATGAERRMKKMERSIEGFGSKLSGIGQTLSIAVTAPMVAFGIASVKAAAESRDAMAQVEASLKSMGDASGRTAAQLGDMASGIMSKSLFDDDEILRKVTANLLTFGNVSGTAFDRAQQAAVDLSARLGTDLQSSAVMVGKALNDPVKGVTALTRVGVSFTKQQVAQIKVMAEAGNAAGAQALILSELEKQYGGSAAAALQAAGPLAALKKRFDALAETVGSVLLVAIERITPTITRIADAFLNLSPGMQTAIVAGAGLLAVLGPVALALGGIIQFAAPMLAFLGTLGGIMASAGSASAAAAAGLAGIGSVLGSLLGVLGPIAIAAGAVYLAWKNWDDIGPRLTPIIGDLRGIAEWLGLIGPKAKEAGDSSADAASDMDDLGTAASKASGTFQKWADDFDAYNAEAARSARDNGTTIQDGLRKIGEAFVGLTQRANAFGADIGTAFTQAVGHAANLYYGVKNWIGDKLAAVLDGVRTKIAQVGDWFHDLYIRVVGNSDVPDMVDGIAVHMARLDQVMVGKARSVTAKVGEAFRQLAGDVRSIMDEVFPDAARLRESRGKVGTIDAAEKAKLVDAGMAAALRNGVLRGLSDAPTGEVDVTVAGTGPLDVTKGLDDVMDSLDTLKRRAGSTTVSIAKSFKDMADATVQSLSNLANSIKGGGFLGILEAVIGLGLQLGSIGAFGKTIAGRINAPKMPAYANGTGFHPGGLALLGERGPEIAELPRGTKVYPNGTGPGGKLQVEVIANNNGFGAIVRNYAGQVVAEAAPALMDGGAQVAQSRMNYRSTRRVA